MTETDKFQVIKALIHFFNEQKENHQFMCIALIEAAAALIEGSTYHYVLGFTPFNGIERSSYTCTTATIDNLNGMEYIFLEEISMVD